MIPKNPDVFARTITNSSIFKYEEQIEIITWLLGSRTNMLPVVFSALQSINAYSKPEFDELVVNYFYHYVDLHKHGVYTTLNNIQILCEKYYYLF